MSPTSPAASHIYPERVRGDTLCSRGQSGEQINNSLAKLAPMENDLSGVGEGPAKVISVSLPEGTVRALRAVVGARGVSSVVAAAVEEYLRNRATALYLDEYQHEHGAFTEDEKRAAAQVWADAEHGQAQRA